MDYSIRIPATEERLKILDEKNVSKKSLSKIKDILLKPINTSLKDFHPDNVAVRIREFVEEDKPATFIKMTFTKTDSGYTDQKEDYGNGTVEELLQKAKQMEYEKWGELETESIEYILNLNNQKVTVLCQNISPLGIFLKIESENQEALDQTLNLLNAQPDDKIEKNAAILLAEKLKLI